MEEGIVVREETLGEMPMVAVEEVAEAAAHAMEGIVEMEVAIVGLAATLIA